MLSDKKVLSWIFKCVAIAVAVAVAIIVAIAIAVATASADNKTWILNCPRQG